MTKKADPKRDAELWKRIEAVYPGKSAEYKKEVYDLLCPEYKIEMLKDVIASMEKTQTIALPLAFYGKDLKKRAKEWSSRGGQKRRRKRASLSLSNTHGITVRQKRAFPCGRF